MQAQEQTRYNIVAINLFTGKAGRIEGTNDELEAKTKKDNWQKQLTNFEVVIEDIELLRNKK